MGATATTYYELLGVTSGASDEEIRAAYQRALAQFRERLGGVEQPGSEHLDALRGAYRTLSDPAARADYDRQLAAAPRAAFTPVTPPPVTFDPYPTRPSAGASDAWRFRFSGDGGEYFRIWIVNLLLSIVTLGIYSAWAKVRREQYFHRHLLLDESAFEYHGQPLAILKGRVVAVVLLVSLSVAENFGPVAYGIVLLCILPLVPWLAIRALRFRAYNTSYRGLRFSFQGGYWEALRVFVGYGLLALMTFWLAFPVWYRRMRLFVLNNLRFGTTEFRCTAGVGEIYGAVAGPMLAMLGLFFCLVILLGILSGVSSKQVVAVATLVGVFVLPAMFLGFQAVIIPWVNVRLTNAVWKHTTLGGHTFQSSLKARHYIALTVVNWLAIIATLGLFFPWARVRIARYRAECMAIDATCDLDSFIAGESQASTALGDETAELFDLDIAL